MGAQRGVVHDEASGQVEEQRATTHLGEVGLAEQALVGRPAVDVQGDDISVGEQFGHRQRPARVAESELVVRVVEDDLHAEVLGQHRKLRADVAVADDAQRQTANLVRAVS